MLISYATALGVLVGLLTVWVAVQRAAARVGSGDRSDPDVLAHRGCGGCLGDARPAACPGQRARNEAAPGSRP